MRALVAIVVVAGLAWGQMDTAADDLSAEQDLYCDMVAEGSWPDYKNTYEKSCK